MFILCYFSSGVEHGNLRELALARMKDLGTDCRDVRTREVGIQEIHNKVRPYEVSFFFFLIVQQPPQWLSSIYLYHVPPFSSFLFHSFLDPSAHNPTFSIMISLYVFSLLKNNLLDYDLPLCFISSEILMKIDLALLDFIQFICADKGQSHHRPDRAD